MPEIPYNISTEILKFRGLIINEEHVQFNFYSQIVIGRSDSTSTETSEEDPVESELELVGGMFDQKTDQNVLLQVLPIPQFLPGYQVVGNEKYFELKT